MEALRRLIAEVKQLDAVEVGARWNQLQGELGVAEGVVRDYVEPFPYAYAYECCQPGTDGKGWTQFINRDPVITCDGVRNVIPLYAAPVAAQPSEAQPDWKARLYAAMDAEFALHGSTARDADGQRFGMRLDDTQIGVEFAMGWLENNRLIAAPQPSAGSAAPAIPDGYRLVRLQQHAYETTRGAIYGGQRTEGVAPLYAIVDEVKGK
jgi:hypothetical protein